MEKFCKDVLDFLKAEYDDSYQFEIKRRIVCPPGLVRDNEEVELTITFSKFYSLTIVNRSMMFIYGCYNYGEYIGERNQYRWQKELIDMIEGG